MTRDDSGGQSSIADQHTTMGAGVEMVVTQTVTKWHAVMTKDCTRDDDYGRFGRVI